MNEKNSAGTVGDLHDLVGKLRQERDDAEKRFAEANEKLKAVEITLGLVSGNESPSTSVGPANSIMENLRGKTQPEALTMIASANNGMLKVKEAKRLMLEAGLISNPKNASSIMYTLIGRMSNFEKVGRGEYRLTGVPRA